MEVAVYHALAGAASRSTVPAWKVNKGWIVVRGDGEHYYWETAQLGFGNETIHQ